MAPLRKAAALALPKPILSTFLKRRGASPTAAAHITNAWRRTA
jgi:hypothetical protein